MKKIYGLILLFLLIYLIQYTSIDAQKRSAPKPAVVITQPNQIPASGKQETQEEKILTNASIIQMVKAGFGENVILNAIQTNETRFDISMSALFNLKNAGVSQKVIEAMQFAAKNERQTQDSNSANRSSQKNTQDSPFNQKNSNLISDSQALPVYGTVSDLKDLNRIYISVENAQSRERIVKALSKAPQYQIVNDPQEAQIFLEYKILSRDDRSDTSDTDLRIKSQMNAVVIKNNKRVIAWSDTVDHVRKTLGGIGWRSTHNEIKLTERFLKALKN